MDKQSQIEELSLEICQYLIPQAYQKDIPPKTRAEDIASHLLNCGYVKIRKGDYTKDYYNNKSFSARTCPSAELVEITTLEDLASHKKIYICSNALCTQGNNCNTICEKTLKDLQYPLEP